ncbi:hypothetical protein J6590_013006 [Homalodisca vitripennis]|nr:hypothetical protein J6590_038673 [Homalodisca vitripennis]KAG8323012.1 hypothetical protein J6590_013006 [Homalodisca vitripennis]
MTSPFCDPKGLTKIIQTLSFPHFPRFRIDRCLFSTLTAQRLAGPKRDISRIGHPHVQCCRFWNILIDSRRLRYAQRSSGPGSVRNWYRVISRCGQEIKRRSGPEDEQIKIGMRGASRNLVRSSWDLRLARNTTESVFLTQTTHVGTTE